MNRTHRISVVAPMRNEAAHIERFLEDVAAQDFEGEIEIFVADGDSSDDSIDRLLSAGRRLGLEPHVIHNPSRWVSHALNACIRETTGDLIVRLDCHSRYPRDYLRRLARASDETGAENVGGLFVPAGRTPMERAVACAMDSPFGGVHWTRDAHRNGRVEADTVPYGAYRRRAFDLAGYFDETLVRDQDDEFNLRLRLAGGRVVLDPSIEIRYTPRSSLRGVFHQYYEYGLWKVPVMLKHRQIVSLRSMVPLAFVIGLLGLSLSAPFSALARVLLTVEVGTYAVCAVAFGALAVRRQQHWRLLPRVVAAYPAFHCGHGLGMLHGWLRAGLRAYQ